MDSHTVYIGLGSNLGDRLSNILEALQQLKPYVFIEKLSSFYETEPIGFVYQPRFLNAVAKISTSLSPHELFQLVKRIEKRMGRQPSFRNAPRPIDIDILFYDDLILDSPEITIPHPRLHERAFVLVPLSEISPDLFHPRLKKSIPDLLKNIEVKGINKLSRENIVTLRKDIQETQPTVTSSLSRVGIKNIQRLIRIVRDGKINLFYATMDLFVDLNPFKMGVHMSRFTDALEEVVDEVASKPTPTVESLAEEIAKKIGEKHDSTRSEARVKASFPIYKVTPVSGKKTQEIYSMLSFAVYNGRFVKRVIGVEAEGMTACPCAQEMVRDYSRERLLEEGFSENEVKKILGAIPIASHNQRGRGTLFIGTNRFIKAEELVEIVESSMSSETYNLLKRQDELFVVNKAHRNPMFVEDVVREMLLNVVETFTDIEDKSFIWAKQENFEGIHKYDAFAERFGTMGEIRKEILKGQTVKKHTSLEEWFQLDP